MLGDEPSEVGRRAECAAVHLGQPEGSVVGGHDDIGVPRDADASPEAEALHRRDHRDLTVVDGGKGGGTAPVHPYQRLVALGLDLLDVHPGTEASALGAHHHHPHRRNRAGRRHGVREREPRRHVEGVHGWDVDDHLGGARRALVCLDTHGRLQIGSRRAFRIVDPAGLDQRGPSSRVFGVRCCVRTGSSVRRSPPRSAQEARPAEVVGPPHGSSEYHDGGVRARSPDHDPDGDAAWCARPSNEMTGKMRFASHSPPATVKCTPSPHRAWTPSTCGE